MIPAIILSSLNQVLTRLLYNMTRNPNHLKEEQLAAMSSLTRDQCSPHPALAKSQCYPVPVWTEIIC